MYGRRHRPEEVAANTASGHGCEGPPQVWPCRLYATCLSTVPAARYRSERAGPVGGAGAIRDGTDIVYPFLHLAQATIAGSGAT